jgi:hypothetical protein
VGVNEAMMHYTCVTLNPAGRLGELGWRESGKKKMTAGTHRVEFDRLSKGDVKIKMVLGAILVSATLLGVNELASAAYRADHGAFPYGSE